MLPYEKAAQCPRSPKDRVWELQSHPQNQDCKQTIHGNREQRKELQQDAVGNTGDEKELAREIQEQRPIKVTH